MARGLMVLVCGIPGCGKDLIGRKCAEGFPSGAALSQDEHGGCGARAQSAAEAFLCEGRSPLFILRNGADASDRLPYVHAAKRHGYRVAAVWPAELSNTDLNSKAALYLASIAGCYGRLTDGGHAGHETLTISGQPAKVCHTFLRSFRLPAAPGEVDSVFSIPFLMDSNWSSRLEGLTADKCAPKGETIDHIASKVCKSGTLPDAVAALLCHSFEDTKKRLSSFAGMRRSSEELSEELTRWVASELLEQARAPVPSANAPAAKKPQRQETKQLQRAIKVRAAIEHLVSPANIKGCRSNGSTVSNCIWLPASQGQTGHRPAWPASYFCGSPQLRRLAVSEDEVLAAAQASATAGSPLQQGDDGVCVEVLEYKEAKAKTKHKAVISPLSTLPEASLSKLGCPDIIAASLNS